MFVRYLLQVLSDRCGLVPSASLSCTRDSEVHFDRQCSPNIISPELAYPILISNHLCDAGPLMLRLGSTIRAYQDVHRRCESEPCEP